MPSFPFFSRFRLFRVVVSGVAVVILTANAPAQAQTSTFNDADYAAYAAYNEKTDVAAASFAAGFARRSADAPVSVVSSNPTGRRVPQGSTRVRPNAPKSQAVQTWEAFLFGTRNRSRSTPKFAFGQRDANSASPVGLDVSRSSAVADVRSARPLQSLQTAQTAQSPTDAEIAAARRRRLQELNAILATRRPEEFSRRLALAESPSVESPQTEETSTLNASVDAPALPILVDAPTVERSNVALQNRAESLAEPTDAPFNVARANRSKIRQASNLEPAQPLELADDGLASLLLPTRPNALRLSPNVFLSTDVVPLPNAAPLTEVPQTPRPAQNAQTSRPAQDVQPARPLESAPASPTVASPLPAAPSTDVPTLRPTAQFVEPRFLPTRR